MRVIGSLNPLLKLGAVKLRSRNIGKAYDGLNPLLKLGAVKLPQCLPDVT